MEAFSVMLQSLLKTQFAHHLLLLTSFKDNNHFNNSLEKKYILLYLENHLRSFIMVTIAAIATNSRCNSRSS